MSTTEATLVAIERFNDAFNQHDVDGLTKLNDRRRRGAYPDGRRSSGSRGQPQPSVTALRLAD